jgi:hypothetical protein
MNGLGKQDMIRLIKNKIVILNTSICGVAAIMECMHGNHLKDSR